MKPLCIIDRSHHHVLVIKTNFVMDSLLIDLIFVIFERRYYLELFSSWEIFTVCETCLKAQILSLINLFLFILIFSLIFFMPYGWPDITCSFRKLLILLLFICIFLKTLGILFYNFKPLKSIFQRFWLLILILFVHSLRLSYIG